MKRFLSTFGCLVLIALASGCGGQPAAPSSAEKPKTESNAHDHEHGEAPHGGTIGEWGGGAYHIEFTVDHAKQEAVVYILGGDAQQAAPIKADKLSLSIDEPAFQVDLMPSPLEGEAEGTSSRFAATHENFGKEQEFSGSVTGVVEGTPYAGDFKESAGAHKHEHESASK